MTAGLRRVEEDGMVARLRWRSEDHGLRGPTWPHHFYLVAPDPRRGKPLPRRSKVRFRGRTGQYLLVLSFTGFDAVDGAHSAASRCHKVVASNRTTLRGAVHGRG